MGVPSKLIEFGKLNIEFAELLIAGCKWLDLTAHQNHFDDFSALPENLRVSVVTTAERSDSNSVERQFFEHVRRHAFRFYYAHAEAWEYLNYDGPPQPRGFIEYTQPPHWRQG